MPAAPRLHGRDQSGQRGGIGIRGGHLVHAAHVQNHSRQRHVGGGDGRWSAGVGQQTRYRDVVERRELDEPVYRYRAVTALVGADDHRLPAAVGLPFDAVKRQVLVGARCAQPVTERLGVLAIGQIVGRAVGGHGGTFVSAGQCKRR